MKALAFAAVLVAVAGLIAGPALGDWEGPVKWSQLPDMETGIDYNSMEGYYICADDFECTSPLPVSDVHWWGSYWGGGTDPQPIRGFTIRFFTDIVEEYSHPDKLLYTAYVPGNCNETFYGYSPYDGTNVYQYYTDIPLFYQTPGEIYWLSIQVDWTWQEPPYWGWHNSADHWRDNAVQAGDPPPWAWGKIVDQDLAFELSVIPEPATLLLVGFGLLGLLIRRRR